jgi:hypothetical protein
MQPVTLALVSLPILLAVSKGLSFSIVFSGLLLGMLAVLVPSMRKMVRTKES